MPYLQFIHESELIVGGRRFATRSIENEIAQPILRYTFNITRTLQQDPNTAEIQIFNLSRESRSAFQVKGLPVSLSAGYTDNTSTIFEGTLQFGSSVKESTDWVTNILAGDGSDQYQKSRIGISLKGPIQVQNVLQNIAETFGVGLGNVKDKIAEGSRRDSFKEFSSGKVLSGKTSDVLTKIVNSMGYEWSIQDNQLILLAPNETLGTVAYALRSVDGKSTGLIGSPEAGEDGFIRVKCLLQPDLLPGRRIDVESIDVNGSFRVEKVQFLGDTWGNEWICDIEARPL